MLDQRQGLRIADHDIIVIEVGSGSKTEWRVIQGTPDFFNTKKMHNALQGAVHEKAEGRQHLRHAAPVIGGVEIHYLDVLQLSRLRLDACDSDPMSGSKSSTWLMCPTPALPRPIV
jgi:hypothetical protein